MQDLDECRAYVVHLRAEHRRLHELVRDIQAALVEGRAQGSVAPAQSRLRALRVELANHFSEEEEGGCIEEALSRRPALAAEAQQVENEHSELLEQLDTLVSSVSSLAADSVMARFHDFATRLRQHEAREAQLIELGFNFNAEHGAEH